MVQQLGLKQRELQELENYLDQHNSRHEEQSVEKQKMTQELVENYQKVHELEAKVRQLQQELSHEQNKNRQLTQEN